MEQGFLGAECPVVAAGETRAGRERPYHLLVYEQIASNKRRAVVYLALFFVVWVGIGAVLGLVFSAYASARNGTTTTPAGAATTGAVLVGILALIGILYTLTSGGRLVLA